MNFFLCSHSPSLLFSPSAVNIFHILISSLIKKNRSWRSHMLLRTRILNTPYRIYNITRRCGTKSTSLYMTFAISERKRTRRHALIALSMLHTSGCTPFSPTKLSVSTVRSYHRSNAGGGDPRDPGWTIGTQKQETSREWRLSSLGRSRSCTCVWMGLRRQFERLGQERRLFEPFCVFRVGAQAWWQHLGFIKEVSFLLEEE